MWQGRTTSCTTAGTALVRLCYASHMAESPMEVILEVRYAWYKIHFFRRKTGGAHDLALARRLGPLLAELSASNDIP